MHLLSLAFSVSLTVAICFTEEYFIVNYMTFHYETGIRRKCTPLVTFPFPFI
jgi:hypothetical protein